MQWHTPTLPTPTTRDTGHQGIFTKQEGAGLFQPFFLSLSLRIKASKFYLYKHIGTLYVVAKQSA